MDMDELITELDLAEPHGDAEVTAMFDGGQTRFKIIRIEEKGENLVLILGGEV